MTAAFTGELQVTFLGDELAELDSPLGFYSEVLRALLIAPRGFRTDFASVPRWAPIVYATMGGKARYEAVLHDLLYQRHGFEPGPGLAFRAVTRAEADAVFHEAMGVPRLIRAVWYPPQPAWRQESMWAGVRTFGWGPWGRSDERRHELNPSRPWLSAEAMGPQWATATA